MSTKLNNKKPYIVIKNQSIFDNIENRINADHRGSTVIVPHICNNVNAFGAGFAAAVTNHFPEVKANFHLLGSKGKLGHTQYVITKINNKYKHSIIFANMIAQNKILSNSNNRPLNYAALVYCMNDINHYINSLQSHSDSIPVEIHAPKFGSGLSGGNWNFISHLIEDIWYNKDVYIYA